MFGDGIGNWKALAALAGLGLAALACAVNPMIQRLDCEASGGFWQRDSVFNTYDCENAGPEYIQKYFPSATLPSSPMPESADSTSGSYQTCDATQALQVTSEITLQETNQFGTRACEYRLTIRNTQGDTGVWVYIFQHDQDGYAHTEKSRWMGKTLLEPGGEETWPASIYLYDDPDADGPLMSIPERIAGVSDRQECAEEAQDLDFFELISIPIESVCPME